MTNKEFIGCLLAGLAAFIIIMSIFVALPWHVHSINKEKTEHAIHWCLDHGYAGFLDTSGNGDSGRVGCYSAGDLG